MGKDLEKKTKLKVAIFFRITTIVSLIYIIWRIFFTIPTGYGIVSFICGIILVVCEAIGIFEEYEHYVSVAKKLVPTKPELKPEDYPDVDVFIATHNESTDLLYKTVNGCTYMEYPDKSKVHIYICDDANRPEMKALAEQLGVGYFGLENNKDAKAGNLNNAMRLTSSKLIATFDADMIPRRDFLMATVPYFFRDEKVGFIQTPQSFYNADLFQFNLYSEDKVPNEQDFFFKEINVGRNRVNAPIYAGSNTLISRQALEEVGGIQTGTVTEDFATGVYIQSKGYKCYAIDDVHANGLAPTDVMSLVKQRERWGRGCVQSFKKANILSNKGLSIGAKISYFSCLLYWWTFIRRYVYIISPILFAVFGVRIVDCSLKEILIFWLPYFILNRYSTKLIAGKIRTSRWSDIIDTIIFPFMIIPIFKETVGIKEKKFVVTVKDRSSFEKNAKLIYALPHIFLLVFAFIGLFMCIGQSIKYETFATVIIIFWLCIDIYNLFMAVFFMMGRSDLRENTRFNANLPIVLNVKDKIINATTKDISETGLNVIFDYPEYIEEDSIVKFNLKNEFYEAKGLCKINSVVNSKDGWQYRFIITSLEEKDRREYYQLVYDRKHSYPTKMRKGLSIYSDFYNNINKRIDGYANSNRTYPRIAVNENYKTSEDKEVTVIDFNYKYILVEGLNNKQNEVEILLGDNVSIKGTFEKRFFKGSHKLYLYRVTNLDELVSDEIFTANVEKWIDSSKTVVKKKHKNRSFNEWDEFDDMEMLRNA